MIWTLAKKDLRLLLRDRRAVVILLAMPFIFILVLGLSLGEGFGQKPDDRLRISLVDLDRGIDNPDIVKQAPRGAEPWSQVTRRDSTGRTTTPDVALTVRNCSRDACGFVSNCVAPPRASVIGCSAEILNPFSS